ncbi:MAG: cytidine deaminase [Spirochaetota bacterium]
MDDVRRAFELAVLSRDRAYAPYSEFRVGAAIKVADSDLICAGCNVENASYGAGVCAERAAVFNMRTAAESPRPEFLVVVTDTDPASVPCAICLQVLAEFCPPDFPIHLANLDGIQRTVGLGDLLPEPFQLEAHEH